MCFAYPEGRMISLFIIYRGLRRVKMQFYRWNSKLHIIRLKNMVLFYIYSCFSESRNIARSVRIS